MEKKIPKWEIEEFDEKDRKYDYSSYALDKAQENKIIKRNEHLTVNNLVTGEFYSYKEMCVLLNEKHKPIQFSARDKKKTGQRFLNLRKFRESDIKFSRFTRNQNYPNSLTTA